MKKIIVIRAYEHEQVHRVKGYKILVDRLWPRGLSKSDLPYEWWLKEMAPSNELRQWFNHQEERYPLFKEKYFAELSNNSLSKAVIIFLKEILKEENLILIYGAKNEHFNQAVVLKEWLEQQQG